jgi:glutamate-1-semialdehyde 2,1-aminomutase
MQFTGLGSMLAPHFRTGAITQPYSASRDEEALRELFFFDMLEAGIYIARRGMVALSLPVGDADLRRFVASVAEFIAARGPLLRCAPDLTRK